MLRMYMFDLCMLLKLCMYAMYVMLCIDGMYVSMLCMNDMYVCYVSAMRMYVIFACMYVCGYVVHVCYAMYVCYSCMLCMYI